MKQFMIRRILPAFLAISLLPVIVVPASAVSTNLVDLDSVQNWNAILDDEMTGWLTGFHNDFISHYEIASCDSSQELFWEVVDRYIGSRKVLAPSDLSMRCQQLNSCFNESLRYSAFQGFLNPLAAFLDSTLGFLFGLGSLKFVVRDDLELGVKRILDVTTGNWLVDSQGRFPYARPEDYTPPAGEEPVPTDQWVSTNTVYKNVIRGEGNGGRFTSKGSLESIKDMYDVVDATPDYEYIYTETGFWSWWQKSWNAFTETLFAMWGTVGAPDGSGGSGDLSDEVTPSAPEEEDGLSLLEFVLVLVNGGKSVVSGVRSMFGGVVSTVPDAMDNLTGAFRTGGFAVGLIDGTGRDPDNPGIQTLDLDDFDYYAAEPVEEVLDPWRYR